MACVNYLRTIIFMRIFTGFLKEISEDSISVLLDKDLTQWYVEDEKTIMKAICSHSAKVI